MNFGLFCLCDSYRWFTHCGKLPKNSKLDSTVNDKLDEVIHAHSTDTVQQLPANQPLPGTSTSGQGQPQGQEKGNRETYYLLKFPDTWTMN